MTPGRAASAGLLAAPGRPRTRLASRACSWTTGEAAAVVKMLASRPLAGCSSSAATCAGLGRLRPISRPNTCAAGSQHAERKCRAQVLPMTAGQRRCGRRPGSSACRRRRAGAPPGTRAPPAGRPRSSRPAAGRRRRARAARRGRARAGPACCCGARAAPRLPARCPDRSALPAGSLARLSRLACGCMRRTALARPCSVWAVQGGPACAVGAGCVRQHTIGARGGRSASSTSCGAPAAPAPRAAPGPAAALFATLAGFSCGAPLVMASLGSAASGPAEDGRPPERPGRQQARRTAAWHWGW